MDIRFTKLPPKNQLQSLLRFSLPDLSQTKRVHRTSVYLNGDGFVVGKPIESGGSVHDKEDENNTSSVESTDEKKSVEESKQSTEEATNATSTSTESVEKAPRKVRVRAGHWAVVSISVQPAAGTMRTYIDGELCHLSTDLDPADLKLQYKLVVLGGGKQAHVRGGDVRRIAIHGDAIQSDDQAKALYFAIANDSPAIGGRALRIQTVYRGFISRKKLKQEREQEERERQEEEAKEQQQDQQQQAEGQTENTTAENEAVAETKAEE